MLSSYRYFAVRLIVPSIIQLIFCFWLPNQVMHLILQKDIYLMLIEFHVPKSTAKEPIPCPIWVQ